MNNFFLKSIIDKNMLVIKHVFIVVLAKVSGALTDKKSAFVWGMGESLLLFDDFHLLQNVSRTL